jgi:tetratricopeptide (TPR) repeat protein
VKIWVDMSQFLPFFYPTFLVVGLMVYFFLRGLTLALIDLVRKPSETAPKKTKSRLLSAFFGRSRPGKAKSKSIATDDSAAETEEESRPFLTDEKIQIYRMAKVLFQQNKIVEAAQMLETIDLAEKAVKILVKHDKVDEAAATLVRMKAFDRVAALYEKHQKFSQASETYMQLENWLKAAQCFDQMAKQDSQFYYMASECYLKADLLNDALAARAKLGLVDDVFHLCVTHKNWLFLGRYLEFPAYAYRILPLFDANLLEEFFADLELVPHTAMLLAHWLNYRSDDAIVLTILRKFGESTVLASMFWQHLDHYGFETMSHKTLAMWSALNSSVIKTHAEGLLAAGRAELAHKILAADVVPPLPVPPLVMKF